MSSLVRWTYVPRKREGYTCCSALFGFVLKEWGVLSGLGIMEWNGWRARFAILMDVFFWFVYGLMNAFYSCGEQGHWSVYGVR